MIKSVSLRVNLVGTVIAMGFLGILLALYVGHVYQNMAVDNQRLAYEELLRLRVGDQFLALEKNSTLLGQSIQNDKVFRDALADQNKIRVTDYLENHFQQYLISAGVLSLHSLHALNGDLVEIGTAYDDAATNQYSRLAGRSCERLIKIAQARLGTERYKKISMVCMNDDVPTYHVLIPIGGFKIIGYLEVVTDPTHNMIAIEDDLGLPVKITLLSKNSVTYQSPAWSNRVDQHMNIIANYDYKLSTGQKSFRVSIVRNISSYRDALAHKRNTLMLTASILTILFAMLMLYFLKKTTLDPLNFLARQIHKLRDGSTQLGTTISLQGITEVEDLADSYNQMTLELKSLYDELQQKNSDLNNENRERQKAEAELKKGKDNLEELVDKRTVDLAIARDTAVKASHSKSLFLANMSHELRTPLNAIIGYTEMLLEDAVRDKKSQYEQDLTKIYSSGRHLLALVKDVLDLSKIEAGRMELELERFNVVDFVNDVSNTATPLAAKNNNEFSVTLQNSLGVITADITKLRQSVLNLLSNAAKFTEAGKISLQVSRKIIQENETIEFTVTDTGIGLSDDQQDRIFHAFNQADVSTTRRYGGTGLGLAICQSYCHMMGGELTVESTSGEGASFTITLPVVVTNATYQFSNGMQRKFNADLTNNRFSREHTDKGRERRGYLSTVLVISEDRVSAEFVEHLLHKHAFKVELVDNRARGLDLATMIQPDIILFDVGVTEGLLDNSWSLLNKDESIKLVPKIMMVDAVAEKNDSGNEPLYIIRKPINPNKLLRSIFQCVRKIKLGQLLLVNKNRGMRAKLHESLEGLGWEIIDVENIDGAMKTLQQIIPTAVLLDASIDQTENIDLVGLLKSNETFKSIPVIVTTNQSLPLVGGQDLFGQVEKIFARDRYSYSQLVEQINTVAKKSAVSVGI